MALKSFESQNVEFKVLSADRQGGKKNVKIKQRNRGGVLYEYCYS